jgi:hypothetical protein
MLLIIYKKTLDMSIHLLVNLILELLNIRG